MRLSKEERDKKIVELYRCGCSYRQLQDRYHLSPNYLARLVQGIEVTCAACGKHKGKVRFHSHHPDRANFPHYTILLCPSCHAKEEAKLRRQKETKSQSPSSPIMPTTANVAARPSTASLSFPPGPLSPTGKKVLTVFGIALAAEVLFPGFFGRWRQGIEDRWKR